MTLEEATKLVRVGLRAKNRWKMSDREWVSLQHARKIVAEEYLRRFKKEEN